VLTTDVEARPAQRSRTAPAATLIAAGRPGAQIAALLRKQGLKTARFAVPEDLPPADAAADPALVVLWAQEHSSLARAISPLTQRFDGTPVLVVCAEIQRWGIRTALNAGAAGVVLFEELQQTFVPCLQAVLTGQICVPRAFSRQIEPPALSSREKQILGLVVMGYMNSQIAERLFLAESTVKSHLSSAFGKLGVRSRNEAVNLILDPDRGLGMGILALVGDSKEPTSGAEQ
jgi:DNA-binding NarL/FixJ family response regulator